MVGPMLAFIVLVLLSEPTRTSSSYGSRGLMSVPYSLSSSFVAPPQQQFPLRPQLAVQSNAGLLEATLTLRAVHRSHSPTLPLLSYTARTLCLDTRCDAPAPTLLVWPGDMIKLTLVNLLEAGSANRTTLTTTLGGGNNNPRATASSAEGGLTQIFSFSVPPSSPPGLHVYSSPSPLHVMSGMLGAILVQPLNSSALSPEYTAMVTQRTVLVLTHVMLGRNAVENPSVQWDSGGAGGTGSPSAPAGPSDLTASLPQLSALASSTLNIADGSSTSPIRDFWLVNGQFQPIVSLRPMAFSLLDIACGSLYRLLELEVRSAMRKAQDPCSMQLLAQDGIFLERPRDVAHLVMLPGQRASVAVRCPSPGRFYLQSVSTSDPDNRYAGVGHASTKSRQVLAVLLVEGISPVPAMTLGPNCLVGLGSPDGTAPKSPTASNVLSDSSPTAIVSISTSQQGAGPGGWLGAGSDCTLPCFSSAECALLYGSNFSSSDFPSSRVGKCTYAPGQSVALSLSSLVPSSSSPQLVQVTIWGTKDFSFPLRLSSPMQFISFTPAASVYGANYTEPSADRSPGAHVLIAPYPEPPSVYALPGDWRDVYAALPGRLVLQGSWQSGQISSLGADMQVHVLPAPPVLPSNHPAVVESALPASPLASAFQPTLSVQGGTPADAFLTSNGSGNVQPLLCSASGSSWGYREVVDMYRAQRVLTVSGCPNHPFQCQESGCGGEQGGRSFLHPASVVLPLYPTFSASPVDVSCSLEPVGYALNGVPFFSHAEVSASLPTRFTTAKAALTSLPAPRCLSPADYYSAVGARGFTPPRSMSAADGTPPLPPFPRCPLNGEADGLLHCGDSVQVRAGEVDACGGMADSSGRYGYRVEPVCLLRQLGDEAPAPSSSSAGVQLGWALDGFPIFGSMGPHGTKMLPCLDPGAHPTLCLDSCGGIAASLPDHDLFLYRYFVGGNVNGEGAGQCSSVVVVEDSNSNSTTTVSCNRVQDKCCISRLPSQSRAPYTLACLVGCVPGHPCEPLPATAAVLGAVVAGGSGATDSRYSPMDKAPQIPLSLWALPPSPPVITSPPSPRSNASSASPSSPADPLASALKQQLKRRAQLLSVTTSATSTTLAETKTLPMPIVASLSVDREIVLLSSPRAEVEAVPRGEMIFGVAGPLGNSLFYTTQDGLYSLALGGHSPVQLVAGVLRVAITGYNFGQALSSVLTVSVRGKPCNSVELLSPSSLLCTLTQTTGGSALTDSDVYVAVLGGETFGSDVHFTSALEAQRSGRPAIDGVTFKPAPFRPHAVALLAPLANSARPAVLFFSSVAAGGGVVYRCLPDGAQVEAVSVGLDKVYGLAVMTSKCSSSDPEVDGSGPCDLILIAYSGGVAALLLPALVVGQPLGSPKKPVVVASPPQGAVSLALDLVGEGRVFVTLNGDKVAVLSLAAVVQASISQLPVALSLESYCRLSGAAVLPPLPGLGEWSQSRLLLLDSNSNRLLLASEAIANPLRLPLNDGPDSAAILWPTALSVDTGGGEAVSVLFISELLGRIWRLRITRTIDSATATVSAKLGVPELLIDLGSTSPSAARLRSLAASNGGVFLDIL